MLKYHFVTKNLIFGTKILATVFIFDKKIWSKVKIFVKKTFV